MTEDTFAETLDAYLTSLDTSGLAYVIRFLAGQPDMAVLSHSPRCIKCHARGRPETIHLFDPGEYCHVEVEIGG